MGENNINTQVYVSPKTIEWCVEPFDGGFLRDSHKEGFIREDAPDDLYEHAGHYEYTTRQKFLTIKKGSKLDIRQDDLWVLSYVKL